MSTAVRHWLAACRPATLTAGAIPVVVGTGVAVAAGGFEPLAAAVALLAAICLQVGTNLVNDVADFQKGADTGERLGPPRAVQQGWLEARHVALAGAAAFLGAALAGAYLCVLGGWPILVCGLLAIGAGVAYTAGPVPLGYLGLGDALVLVFFGGVAVCGTVWVQLGHLPLAAGVASVPVGFLATAILVVNNLRDRRTDALAGKRTLAVRFGARFARAEYLVLVVGAYAVVAAAAMAGRGAGWLLPCLTFPLAVREIRAVRDLDGAALNPHLGGTARLGAAFGLLLAVGVAL